MSNLIIVESKNDEYFIEAFIDKLNLNNDTKINNKYERLNGLNNLEETLGVIIYAKYDKLGIILDANKEGIKKRLEFINKALKKNLIDVKIDTTNTLIKSTKLKLEIACYIMNIDGCGELDTVLKTIKSKPSEYADCLDSWRNCLEKEGKKISKKDFDKFWVNNYLRFDTCSTRQMQQAYKECARKKAMEKNIWNFEHDALVNLKVFLELFK